MREEFYTKNDDEDYRLPRNIDAEYQKKKKKPFLSVCTKADEKRAANNSVAVACCCTLYWTGGLEPL